MSNDWLRRISKNEQSEIAEIPKERRLDSNDLESMAEALDAMSKENEKITRLSEMEVGKYYLI